MTPCVVWVLSLRRTVYVWIDRASRNICACSLKWYGMWVRGGCGVRVFTLTPYTLTPYAAVGCGRKTPLKSEP